MSLRVYLTEGPEDEGGHDEAWESQSDAHTLVRPDPRTKTPSFYKVVILNDDFTPRDFVVHILQKFFQKTESDATQLMLQVHNKGAGIAGVYTHEIAETKAYQVNEYARQSKYPLRCVTEKA